MPIAHNTGDWFGLRPDTYRKIDLLTPDWPQNMDSMHVVAAPFGGPIAVKTNSTTRNNNTVIRILSTAGTELGKFLWNHGKLITMGWSDAEELVCVQDDAFVHIYDIYGSEKETFSIGGEPSSTKIIDAKIFQSYSGTGIALVTTNQRIFLKVKKDARKLPEMPPSQSKYSCWEIVTEDRNSYCLVGRDRDIYKLYPGDSVGKIHQNLFVKPYNGILHMSVSYNHKNLALYTDTGLIWMGSVDMKRKYFEFDTKRRDVPRQIEWVMNVDNSEADAVVISYPSFLLVVNRNDNQNLFTYDSAICLVAEIDGVRILTKTTHEMIQRLPACVQNIFAINSQEPSGYLFEAHKKFQENSHKSDVYLSFFRNRMENAVSECIKAAGYEFCIEVQKSLMRAAYFGKGFIPSHNPDSYIQMLRILSVLNTLRHEKIAIQLTYSQFQHLKPEVVLGRLVYRKHYAIALQVAKDLNLPESWILERWAYDKILNDKNDSAVERKITEKFRNPSVGISFCKIADKAHAAGRDKLAIKLLELEPRCALQVPLLLKLDNCERAIQKATESGDTELVVSVILESKKKMMLSNFHITVRAHPMALNLYKKMMNEYSGGAFDIINMEDDHKSIAEYHFRNAIERVSLESDLAIIVNSYTKAQCLVEAELCSDTSKMLKLQKTFATRYAATDGQIPFYGMSIHDTILQLLKMGELKEAEKIKNDFKVPERRFWWLRIRTMAEKYKWDDLEKFAKSKRSPVGYEPFVEVCLEQNNLHEARKYILKCRDDRKTRWYMRAELYEEAGDCAFDQRDIDTLYVIQEKASNSGNRTLLQNINKSIATLASKR